MNINNLNGIPIIIIEGKKIQKRKHKKRRINKKWAKRYGFITQNLLEDGQIIYNNIDDKLYMNKNTFIKLKDEIEKEKLINGKPNINQGINQLFGF